MSTPKDPDEIPPDVLTQIVRRNLGYAFTATSKAAALGEAALPCIPLPTTGTGETLAEIARKIRIELEVGIDELTGNSHPQPLLEPLRQFLIALEAGFQELAGDGK